jgi:hypothetical protein
MRAWSLAGSNCTGSFVAGMMTMEGILKDDTVRPDITQIHLIVIGITSLAVPRLCLFTRAIAAGEGRSWATFPSARPAY